MKIQMVDLYGQYLKIKDEINSGIQEVIETTSFINGPKVKEFATHLAEYCDAKYVIPCANGTDALQIALMALGLKPGDEVIVPAFTYVASAEVIGLLGLIPVMVDVDYESFNITESNIIKALSTKTKAIIPVHLFGQSCDMEPIMQLAEKYNLYVIEDNAQALGAVYSFSNGTKKHTGTIGHIGCTSFFPSKNLGCYGDGGAVLTNDENLAKSIQMIANHGQQVKYHHKVIGCNSRLDTMQAAVLDVKLKHLDEYCQARKIAAAYYSQKLQEVKGLTVPMQISNSTHVFHQYTLKVHNGERDTLKDFLAQVGIPSMIYYPLPLQQQEAFKDITRTGEELKNAETLANSVLSLPIHTEITQVEQDYIISRIKDFFK
ncbi:DegT/DnrJ/EryC1/StrS aminotransferase family protein [Bacteroides sp. 519]|uniref:DegT/DnrJ/EryC1/StrS family aminotransferase n=1 Tax=Bacteroides sp. 519 TaxID=2302937 RepID=UPI0013D6DD71|nr:DegT/DnrJ/EryC1/StrS family aminotransferase [Bacteroides sp. 519]NDV58978.1 DegT/DnrJ/EryC1/StrS family aminotransferase [Bacteroides sp. 519]